MAKENKSVNLQEVISKPWTVKIFNQMGESIRCWQSGGFMNWKVAKRMDPGEWR